MTDLPPTTNGIALLGCPHQISQPSSVLLNDATQATIPFQQQAAANFLNAEREQWAAEVAQATPAVVNQFLINVGPSDLDCGSPILALPKSKWAYVEDVEDEDNGDGDDNNECKDACLNPKPQGEYYISIQVLYNWIMACY